MDMNMDYELTNSEEMDDWMSDAPLPPPAPVTNGSGYPQASGIPPTYPTDQFPLFEPFQPAHGRPGPSSAAQVSPNSSMTEGAPGPSQPQPSTSQMETTNGDGKPIPPSLNFVESGERRAITVHVLPDKTVTRCPRDLVMCKDDEVDENIWCTVDLYEEEKLAGKSFSAIVEKFTVDGYCANNREDRFSIGTNNFSIVPSSVNQVRSQIGRGITIEKDAQDRIFLYNESESPVFVQTPNYASMVGDPQHTVYRVSGCLEQNAQNARQMQIADTDYFGKVLERNMKEGRRSVQTMNSLCTVRVSFVKGFGSNYRRQRITQCPCWIEIKFDQFLRRLDRALECMQPDDFDLNSV